MQVGELLDSAKLDSQLVAFIEEFLVKEIQSTMLFNHALSFLGNICTFGPNLFYLGIVESAHV